MTGGSVSKREAPFRLPHTPVEGDLVATYFRGLGQPTRLPVLEPPRDEGELSVACQHSDPFPGRQWWHPAGQSGNWH